MTDSGFLAETRASYDTIADDYAEWISDELASKPLDRAVLGGFAELVRELDSGPVADIGCGPGRVTAYLHEQGVPVFGVDLSSRMVAAARERYPGLRFEQGSMTALELADASLGGVLAWYSIIHIPQRQLPEVLAEFRRVLVPGGYLQVAFQVGDEPVHRDEVGGHAVSLSFHPRRPEAVAELLNRAGLPVRATLVREPDEEGKYTERQQQAFLLARKP